MISRSLHERWVDVPFPSFRRAPRFVRTHVPRVSSGRAVDIGCGRGAVTLHLARVGYEALGFDPVLQTPLPRHRRLRFQTGDARHYDFGREKFDLVVILNVLQLLSNRESQELLDRVYVALRPSGRLILTGFTEDDPLLLDARREIPNLVDGTELLDEDGRTVRGFLRRDQLLAWCEQRSVEVLHHQQMLVDDAHPPVDRHQHALVRLVGVKSGGRP